MISFVFRVVLILISQFYVMANQLDLDTQIMASPNATSEYSPEFLMALTVSDRKQMGRDDTKSFVGRTGLRVT